MLHELSGAIDVILSIYYIVVSMKVTWKIVGVWTSLRDTPALLLL